MSTISTIAVLNVTLPNGTELPMRARETQSGNTAWAVMQKKSKTDERYYSKYGVRIVGKDVLGGAAPKEGDTVTVDGTTFKLERKLNEREQVQLRTTGDIVIPGAGKKVFKLILTDVGEGEYNLIAEVHGKSEGGGRKATSDL